MHSKFENQQVLYKLIHMRVDEYIFSMVSVVTHGLACQLLTIYAADVHHICSENLRQNPFQIRLHIRIFTQRGHLSTVTPFSCESEMSGISYHVGLEATSSRDDPHYTDRAREEKLIHY